MPLADSLGPGTGTAGDVPSVGPCSTVREENVSMDCAWGLQGHGMRDAATSLQPPTESTATWPVLCFNALTRSNTRATLLARDVPEPLATTSLCERTPPRPGARVRAGGAPVTCPAWPQPSRQAHSLSVSVLCACHSVCSPASHAPVTPPALNRFLCERPAWGEFVRRATLWPGVQARPVPGEWHGCCCALVR